MYELSAQDLADLVTADAKHQRHALKKLGGVAGVAAKLKVRIGRQFSFAFDSYIVTRLHWKTGFRNKSWNSGLWPELKRMLNEIVFILIIPKIRNQCIA